MAPAVSFFIPSHNNLKPTRLDLALKLVLQINAQIHNSRRQTLLVLVFRTMPIQEGAMDLVPNQINTRFFPWLLCHPIALKFTGSTYCLVAVYYVVRFSYILPQIL